MDLEQMDLVIQILHFVVIRCRRAADQKRGRTGDRKRGRRTGGVRRGV